MKKKIDIFTFFFQTIPVMHEPAAGPNVTAPL